MEKWETFISKVNEYNNRCYDYAENIAHQIAEKTELTVWSRYENKPGINVAGLASFIWQKQLGIMFDPLRLEDRQTRWEILYAGQLMGIGTEQEMRYCWEVVRRLAEDKETVADLLNMPSDMKLEQEAELLKQELINLIQSHKLKGNCSYVRL